MNNQQVARELIKLAKSIQAASIPNFNRFVDEYETDDYPYGKFRTTATFYIEGSKGKQRVVRVTINPKNGKPNKPKKTTYGYAAKLGIAGDKVYPIIGGPGQIMIMSGDMKHSEGYVHSGDNEYRKLADALGIETGPKKVEIKKTTDGAVIDGLQGKETTIREIMEMGGLSSSEIAEVENVKRKNKIIDTLFIVNFKSDRKPYTIIVRGW